MDRYSFISFRPGYNSTNKVLASILKMDRNNWRTKIKDDFGINVNSSTAVHDAVTAVVGRQVSRNFEVLPLVMDDLLSSAKDMALVTRQGVVDLIKGLWSKYKSKTEGDEKVALRFVLIFIGDHITNSMDELDLQLLITEAFGYIADEAFCNTNCVTGITTGFTRTSLVG